MLKFKLMKKCGNVSISRGHVTSSEGEVMSEGLHARTRAPRLGKRLIGGLSGVAETQK